MRFFFAMPSALARFAKVKFTQNIIAIRYCYCNIHTWAVPDVDLHDVIRRESASLSKPTGADGAVSRLNNWLTAIYCKVICSIVHNGVKVIWDTLHINLQLSIFVEVVSVNCLKCMNRISR